MTFSKRVMDLAMLVFLVPAFAPILAVTALLVWMLQGRPRLYGSECMRGPGEAFWRWKFRSMTHAKGDQGVSGGQKRWHHARWARITSLQNG